MSAPYQEDAFQSEQNISGNHSHLVNNEKKSPSYVSSNLVRAQNIVKISIILFVLLFSYLLYGKYLRQNFDGYSSTKKTEFIGDLYNHPDQRANARRGAKNRDGLSGTTSMEGDYMNFGEDTSNVSENPLGDGSEYGRERNRAKDSGRTDWGKSGGRKRPGKGSKDKADSRGWFWWIPEIVLFPARKVRDSGRWIGNLFKGKSDKDSGKGSRGGRWPSGRDRNYDRRQRDKGQDREDPYSRRDRDSGRARGKGDRRKGDIDNRSPFGGTEHPGEGGSEKSDYPLGKDEGKGRKFKNKSDESDFNPDLDMKEESDAFDTDLYGGDLQDKGEERPTKGRQKYDNWKQRDQGVPAAKIPDYSGRKHSVPRERMGMPSLDDIRKNPEKYHKSDFLDADPEQSKIDDDREDKELDELFGKEGEDGEGEGMEGDGLDGDLDIGDIGGLMQLLDPNFLNNIQGMIYDLNGSIRNLNRNKELLKKYKKEIDTYKMKRNLCRDKYRKEKKEIKEKEDTKKNLKQALIDMESEKGKLEETIKNEEDQYMRGNQRNLKKKRGQLESEILDLEEIIQNEKPLLAELDNKRRQENDILKRIEELKEKIKRQEALKERYNKEIEGEEESINLNKKDLTIAKIKIRGFSKSMAVKEENMKLRDLVDDVKSKSMNIAEELDRIYKDKTLTEEELQMILEEMREFGDLDLDLNYKSDHEKFKALKDTLEELKKKALTMDFKGIEKDIEKLKAKIKDNQKIERSCKNNITRSNQKIEDLKEKILKTENILKSLYAELKKLEGQLKKCRDYINSKTQELKNAKEMRDEKRKQQRELNKELQKLQNEHVQQNNSLREEKAKVLKDINGMREHLQKNRADLHKQNKRVGRLFDDCHVFEKYAQDLKRRALKIKKKFPAYQKSIKKLKREIKNKLKALSGIQM